MSHTTIVPDLSGALGVLEALLDVEDQPRIRELQGRLASGDLRVLLVGEAKRGKSTLANALLDRSVMPTGVTPVTALPTLVHHGSPERLEVSFADGTTRTLSVSEVGEYVTQQHNPENVKDVEQVRLVLDRGLPHDRMVLVDSPGVGSVFAHNTQETETALESMDLALLVLTADAPMSESEAELLHRVAELSVEVLVILNKVDLLTDDEAVEAREFVTVTATMALGFTPTTLVCSGRHGIGIKDLAAALHERLENGRLPALQRSVGAAARRFTARRIDQEAVALASIQALRSDREAEVVAFSDAVTETRKRQEEVERLLGAEVARLAGALYESSRNQLSESTRAVRMELEAHLSHAPEDAAETETQGLSVIATAVRSEVERWRADRTGLFVQALQEQRQRAQRALAESAEALGQAAQRLLGVTLSADVQLRPDARLSGVSFDFDPAPDWNQALVTAARQHGPGAQGRVARHLRSQVREQVDKHLGRARIALQEDLGSRAASLAAVVSAAFEEQSAGLARAYAHALSLRDHGEARLSGEAARLARRIDSLRAVHQSMAPVGTAGA